MRIFSASFRLPLALILASLALTGPGHAATAGKIVYLHFLCTEAEGALRVARAMENGADNAALRTPGCRPLAGRGLPAQGGIIERIVHREVIGTRMIEIGEVRTGDGRSGYSAGVRPALLF